jgi:hypothetical protein
MKDHKTAGGFQEVGSRKRVLSQRPPGEPQNIDAGISCGDGKWSFPSPSGRSLQVSKNELSCSSSYTVGLLVSVATKPSAV